MKQQKTESLRYFIANKPYNTICQFTPDVEGQQTLADLEPRLPADVYAVGRLDLDSEGLLLLTNDKKLNHLLLNPQFGHQRTYLAQIEEIPTEETLDKMRRGGLDIKVDKKARHITLPCKVRKVDTPSVYFDNNEVWQRDPPAKASANKPMSWLEITLTEGKYRQVRKMCAAIGHPCLRLIRVSIKDIKIGNIAPNEVREINRDNIYKLLGI